MFPGRGMLCVCACPHCISRHHTEERENRGHAAAASWENPSGMCSGSSFSPGSQWRGRTMSPLAAGSGPGVVFASKLDPCTVPRTCQRGRCLQIHQEKEYLRKGQGERAGSAGDARRGKDSKEQSGAHSEQSQSPSSPPALRDGMRAGAEIRIPN